MKRYELTYISDKRWNFDEERYGFYYGIRDTETGYNYGNQFLSGSNKRQLVKILRMSGVYCPHKVYRAIG